MLLLKFANLIFITLCNCYLINYDNYTLYQATADTQEKMTFYDKIDNLFHVNFWTRPGLVNMSVQFAVAPKNKMELLALAEEYHVPLTIQIDNIQRVFDKQVVKEYERTRTSTFNWKSYFRINDIYNWLTDLRIKYPDRLKIYSIGKSYERREIMAASIILKNTKPRPRIIIEGGIHAREWLGVSMVTYLLHQILTAPSSKDKKLKRIASKYEWYFVPVLNPDGYEYTHCVDRMYRTNKRHVDLNRNFDYVFGTVGVSHVNNTSPIYCGPYAFSEPETKSMRDFVKSLRHNLKYYISFHCYGQFILIPYANTRQLLDNYAELKIMGDKAAKKIAKPYGTKYRVGNAFSTIVIEDPLSSLK